MIPYQNKLYRLSNRSLTYDTTYLPPTNNLRYYTWHINHSLWLKIHINQFLSANKCHIIIPKINTSNKTKAHYITERIIQGQINIKFQTGPKPQYLTKGIGLKLIKINLTIILRDAILSLQIKLNHNLYKKNTWWIPYHPNKTKTQISD